MTKEVVLKETQATYTPTPATEPTLESIVSQVQLTGEPALLVRDGKPIAALVPISTYERFVEWQQQEKARTWQEEQERLLQKEIIAFERMKPELLKTHKGKWVIILNGQLVDSGDDRQTLSKRAREKFGDRTMLIEQVRDKPRVYVVDSPERVC